MKHLKYCPKCGQETLIFDGEKKFSCSQCDFVMYQNIAAAVAVLIRICTSTHIPEMLIINLKKIGLTIVTGKHQALS